MSTCLIRGRTLSFKSNPKSSNDSNSYQYIEDGALLIIDGKISCLDNFQEVIKQSPPGISIYDHRNHLVMPGFIDAHIHFPQIQLIGSYASNLLEWLNNYTYIEEQKFKSYDHGSRIAKFFFDELINHGTTTAATFCSVHVESAEAFFTESKKRNMLMIGGKVMMDRNAPIGLLDTPQTSYDDTKKLIKKWHGINRQYYAISPRFAITSTPEQLEMVQALGNEHPDCHIQTHISENKDEIALTSKLYPNFKDYMAIYEKYNLLGSKTLLGHCIHLSEREYIKMGESNSVAVFCPTSNLFLGSGLFNNNRYKNTSPNVRLATATDIGGGTNYSMLKTMDEAYKILQLQGQRLSPIESFYQITLGNARALSLEDKIGTLEVGSDADIAILNATATTAMKIRMEKINNLSEELFILQTMGDDRSISQVYIRGVPSKNIY